MALPTSSAHLSRPGQNLGAGAVDALHIEEYGGVVEGTIAKVSFMRQYVEIKPVIGTNQLTNDRLGEASLQAVTPGVRPDADVTEFSNVSVTVDTIVLARNNVALLDDFQARYSARAKIGDEHGKKIGKFFDEAFIIQSIKCALHDGTGLPAGWNGGTKVELAAASDELDATKFQRGIEDVCQNMEENDVELDGAVILVKPAQYYTLLRNDKLVDSQYSLGNGDYAQGIVLKSNGVPVIKTNRIPTAAVTDHFLSNAGNSAAYDLAAASEEIDAVAIVMLPSALLAGETIPLTSDVYYEKAELQWFIDSYLAFGVTPNRPEYCGVVLKYRA
jgi:hypothetical protein